MRLICWARTVWYTLRYWLSSGDLGATVSGHAFGEPTYRVLEDREYEDLRCDTCGVLTSGWTPFRG